MGRWEPDARGRLLRAAIELFLEQGYDATTTTQIAARAGLTKTTLFRLFADKREILFQGQQSVIELAVHAIQEAPVGSSPIQVLSAAVTAMSDTHSEQHQVAGRKIDSIIETTPELQERAVFKRFAITRAIEQALEDRLGDPRRAGLLADLGVGAYYDAFASWITAGGQRSFTDVVVEEIEARQTALGTLLLDTVTDRPTPVVR